MKLSDLNLNNVMIILIATLGSTFAFAVSTNLYLNTYCESVTVEVRLEVDVANEKQIAKGNRSLRKITLNIHIQFYQPFFQKNAHDFPCAPTSPCPFIAHSWQGKSSVP